MAHVWEKSYPQGVSWGAPLPPAVPLESLLETAAAKWPDRIAIDFYDRTFTFRELHDLAARAAKGLQALGVGPGVHVGLHLPNTPHYVISFFAVLMAGGRVVNFSPLAAPRELKYQLIDAETQVMITLGLPMLYPQIAALKGTGKFATLVVCSIADFLPAPIAAAFGPAADRVGGAGREIDFAALIANDGAFRRHEHGPIEDEVAVLQYTGGTTGQPKGAMLTHANFCAVLDIFNHWNGLSAEEEPEKELGVLPLFHIFGLTFIMLLSIADGSQMVLHIRFDPDRVLADIARKKITAFPAVPTMYTALVNHPKVKEFDLSSVWMWSSGGAPLPMEVLQRFEALTGRSPKEGYGLTETAALGTLQIIDGPARQGSVGLPAPHTLLEVVDLETGTRVLPIGEKGEICIRGPQVMKGYWKKPEATEEAFRGGRFHTGDIGFIDQDGFVTLVDRKKDMILSGGFNVFPRNIEEAIYEHPGVAEVTVIGVPDAYRGQSAKAFIALKPGHAPFGIDELKAFLADKLAKYEMPTEMEIRASLPKTPVGKLSKKELVAEEVAKRRDAEALPAGARDAG
ncbi:MAG TPA: long-chain fatty acid--CoA ligase [Xanthobacteraceae bacterium]|nr:long-chain fatty acid--CoA ligase [Xanthobacteraceae bacterium]